MSAQMKLFSHFSQAAPPQERCFALLELHEEKAYTAEELLEELEPYTGKIDIETQEVLTFQVHLLPQTNFFIMDVSGLYT